MSNSSMPVPAGAQGTVGTARQESAELKQTVQEQAGDVASAVKDEASTVAAEARSQARELYRRTRSELSEQAEVQQRRVALGLRSVGDELSDMASAAEHPGVGADLVRDAASRARGAAEWLGARDPQALLREVKSFARRKPGTFFLVAAVAGVVVGRLTRALASDAVDDRRGAATSQPGTAPIPSSGSARGPVPTPPPPVAHLSATDGARAASTEGAGGAAGAAHVSRDTPATPARELLDPEPELGAPTSPGPRHGAAGATSVSADGTPTDGGPLDRAWTDRAPTDDAPLDRAPLDRAPDADRLPDEGGLR